MTESANYETIDVLRGCVNVINQVNEIESKRKGGAK